jgi:RAB protein geranylgeranyltransferase component A
MTSEECPTEEALKLIHKFIHSAGRFGNTPFLFTLYGTGELPQAFCRLCAVFGGTYCLKKKLESIIVDKENKCKAVVINGRRIDCDFLVTDYTIESSAQSSRNDVKLISRAIIISDASIKSSDSEQLSLLHIPKSSDNKTSVNVIEVGGAALVAPKGLCMKFCLRFLRLIINLLNPFDFFFILCKFFIV